jgi:hypothetical protein
MMIAFLLIRLIDFGEDIDTERDLKEIAEKLRGAKEDKKGDSYFPRAVYIAYDGTTENIGPSPRSDSQSQTNNNNTNNNNNKDDKDDSSSSSSSSDQQKRQDISAQLISSYPYNEKDIQKKQEQVHEKEKQPQQEQVHQQTENNNNIVAPLSLRTYPYKSDELDTVVKQYPHDKFQDDSGNQNNNQIDKSEKEDRNELVVIQDSTTTSTTTGEAAETTNFN